MQNEQLAIDIQKHPKGHIHNAQFYSWEKPILPLCRGVMFGESFFTSFRVKEGKVHCADLHYKRLQRSFDFFKLRKDVLDQCWEMLSLFKQGDQQMRLSFYRHENDQCFGILSYRPFENPSSRPVRLILSERLRRENATPAFIKWGNYAQENYELMMAKEENFDDVCWRNAEGNMTEASTASLLFWDGENYISPAPGPGVLEGVSIQFLSSVMEIKFKQIKELSQFQEIFLLSGVRGVRKVECIGHKGQQVWTSHQKNNKDKIQSLWETGFNQ